MAKRTLHPIVKVLIGLAVTGVVLAGIGLTAFLYVGYLIGQDGVTPIKFESAAWKATPSTGAEGSVRQNMVDDLLSKHTLVGMTQAEVEELLGPTEDKYCFVSYDLVYVLGPERGMGPDLEWLLIKLDASGKVSEAFLATD